jgi:hypothetical protein
MLGGIYELESLFGSGCRWQRLTFDTSDFLSRLAAAWPDALILPGFRDRLARLEWWLRHCSQSFCCSLQPAVGRFGLYSIATERWRMENCCGKTAEPLQPPALRPTQEVEAGGTTARERTEWVSSRRTMTLRRQHERRATRRSPPNRAFSIRDVLSIQNARACHPEIRDLPPPPAASPRPRPRFRYVVRDAPCR